MVLVFQSDPLDTEDARGRFYHVCLGCLQDAEMAVPPPDLLVRGGFYAGLYEAQFQS